MKNLKQVSLVAGALGLVLALSACDSGSDSNGSSNTPSDTHLRVSHASADAPMVRVNVDGSAVSTEAYDYGESTGELAVPAGEHSLSVDALLPDGSSATVLGPLTDRFNENVRYDVFAVGSVADETLDVFVLDTPVDFDETMVRVTVAHLTENAPMVDVHVTAPGAELNAGTVLGSFSFEEVLGPVEIAAGDYQVRVTPAGSMDVLYDSGTLPLSAGSDLVIGAVPNVAVTPDTASGKSPVALMVVAGEGASLVQSVTDGADLRVVHNSADAPAVDVVVNDDFAAPLVSDLAFPDFTPYVNVPAGTYNVKVAAAGTETVVIDADLPLENSGIYTVLAVNTLENIEPLVLEDMPRSVATEAKLRAIHGSTLAGEVDIYVTAEGADIESAMPAVSGAPFKADTGYVALTPGTYDVTVTPAGSKTAAIGPLTVELGAGGIYTIVARDEMGLNGVGVTLMDSFSM